MLFYIEKWFLQVRGRNTLRLQFPHNLDTTTRNFQALGLSGAVVCAGFSHDAAERTGYHGKDPKSV